MSAANRRAFALLFACLLSVGMGQSMLFSILPPAAREIGITPFQVSTIFATSAFLWVFVSPWWGRKSDVTGRRKIILIGLLGYATSMAALATVIRIGTERWLPASVVYPLLIASRCIFALVGSGTGPASQAYIADRTSRSERTAGVALVSAAMGLGETIGPGVGAALASFGIVAPLYLAAALAVVSAATIWHFLPETELPREQRPERPPRMRVGDRRVLPFLGVVTALQAVRATTIITLAFFLQDTLQLDAHDTVRYSGTGFVVLAIAGLFSQLVIVQRFRPAPRTMIRVGTLLMLAAFLAFVFGSNLPVYFLALAALGLGMGLVRPGAAAAASLAVTPAEQGSVAGLLGGVSVIGNVFGPMLGTALYSLDRHGPHLMNSAVMALILVLVWTNARIRRAHA
ncbi:MAG: MFS transporter [Candidatus Binatia bacterium]|nr:MFS transporter [Candidatus Binatia bacterium]